MVPFAYSLEHLERFLKQLVNHSKIVVLYEEEAYKMTVLVITMCHVKVKETPAYPLIYTVKLLHYADEFKKVLARCMEKAKKTTTTKTQQSAGLGNTYLLKLKGN